jgi:uncharacterized protein (TIGR02996 family)
MTTDQAAFIKAIQTNYADQAPRLAYADWLNEHGMFHAERKQREIAATIAKCQWMWKLPFWCRV